MNFEEEEEYVNRLSSEIEHQEKVIATEEKNCREAELTLTRTQNAQEILQLISQAIQQRAHEKIAGVVSSCLTAVFDDPYEFKIEFERKRGRTEANLRFCRRGLVVDPLTASGGGVVDIAAFALRVSCLMLHRPRLSRLIILDEPFKFVSAEYRPNIKSMLEELAEDLGLQIVMVTHIDELETGKIIQV